MQVCVQLPENSDREIGNLMDIPDHYPKYVVTANSMDVGIENGIRIVHLRTFCWQSIGDYKIKERAAFMGEVI